MNNEKTQELLRLVSENPTLPVCAMVDSDVVCDGYGWWMASFGSAHVGEIAVYDEHFFDNRVEFEERYFDNHDEELCEKFQYDPWVGVSIKGEYTAEQVAINKEHKKALDQYLDELADKYFTKAIIVYVIPPNEFIKKG